ncbi:aromatic/alkene monooxygenase hydroxylase subunit beta [Caballeronia novacaledonica]|uniref:aromatic/alkene monooxygenase hydroxylase subunit beta n=1 Tax=Caballeronia novacaledonica TaxID=1544861 RepID=UPI001EE1C917|nr:aromatic/alkene monooxygenase hydroxylase subunit beta [Caballeronia novacaledonica]GJH14692.1 aromatic/alkene monooxygenase hydroxylase subunit beta [Caballeronia novacaledonica]
MQIDIKTSAVEQVRQTFSHVARRLGADKPASRYQEATFDLQPEVNFHYRPLWQPEFELYDKGRTAIVMNDWYAFNDPRQYYYGAYTIARSRQQEAMEKNFEFVARRRLLSDLSDETKAHIASLMVPLRHVEWAANTNNCFVTGYGWGTAITQATMFHCMDRLGIAQYLSRIGLALDGNQGTTLVEGKARWLDDPMWQGLRRVVEDTMVVRDWFETFVAQNVVLDGLLYPLVYRHIDERITRLHGPGLGMLNEFASSWFDETSRWVDATIKTAAAESPANAALLGQWIAKWRAAVIEALKPLAIAALDDDAHHALEAIAQAFDARIAKQGVEVSHG